MKNPTIWCSAIHTIKLNQKNYYNWYFILDSNIQIAGSDRRGVYSKITIPIKYSDYHYKILKDTQLNNTFKIRLNQNNRIEIMATYNIDKQYTELNEIKDIVGIDIGLKKLIFCSDGEIIDQNPKIINYAKYINKRKSNLWNLGNHLKKIRGDDYERISQKHLIRQYSKLTHMVNCDNRYKIKQFLKGRDNDLIVMEDLNIQHPHLSRQANTFLRLLHIQQIKEDVLKYCKEYGINIQLVNPSYTSQQCPICGYVDKKNRKTQEKFSCLNCGHTDNADHNASINIRDRIYIEDIKLDTPNWRIKELIALHYTTNN
jgi:putative transposase